MATTAAAAPTSWPNEVVDLGLAADALDDAAASLLHQASALPPGDEADALYQSARVRWDAAACLRSRIDALAEADSPGPPYDGDPF